MEDAIKEKSGKVKIGPRELPSTNPMMVINEALYKVPSDEKPKGFEVPNKLPTTPQGINKMMKKENEDAENFRKEVLDKTKLMHTDHHHTDLYPGPNGRILEVEERVKEHQKLFLVLDKMNATSSQDKKGVKKIRKLFEIPS